MPQLSRSLTDRAQGASRRAPGAPRRGRGAGTLAPVALVALACALAGPLRADGDVEGLLDAAAGGSEVTVPALADALLDAGPDGGLVWRRALELRRPERELPDAQEAPAQLDAATLTRLEDLAARVPAELELRLPGLDPAARLVVAQVGLDLLAATGDAQDLDRCLALATPHDEHDHAAHLPVGRRLSTTVTAILQRDARAYGAVAWRYGAGHGWLDLHLLYGLVGAESAQALQLMPSLLHAVPDLDATVLLEVGNLGYRLEVPLGPAAAQRVRMFLTSPDAEERKQVALTVGRLNDFDAVRQLIDLLADEDTGVGANALWSLRRITAMTINAEPGRWRSWYETETAWWSEEAADLLAGLQHPDSAEVCRAINECAKRRLFRHQLTEPLRPLLDHADATVVRAACSAFLALRATEAAPAMASVLEHEEQEVVEHALAMLRELTGLDLPADAALWSARLAEHARPMAR